MFLSVSWRNILKKILIVIKRIIKNPRIIFAYINAIGFFNFFSDRFVIKLLWWVRTGKKIDLGNPTTFNEKIQWLKLYDKKDKYSQLVDKYKVRNYIANLIGEKYLVPLIGVWDSVEEIPFDSLPNQFVLKCNHNAAVGLTICRNKDLLDTKRTKSEIKKGMRRNFYFSSREWAYKNVERKIICEKYLNDSFRKELRDYKFFCFNGKAKLIYVSEGLEHHDTAKISFFDLKGNSVPFHRNDYKEFSESIEFPQTLDEMIRIAEIIAADVNAAFVRVDLYSVDNQVFFSEITFYPNSGYIPFEPNIWDKTLGSWIDLKN